MNVNVFYPIYIIISTCSKYKNLRINAIKYFTFFFPTRSLKSGIYSTHSQYISVWTSHSHLLNNRMWLLSTILDTASVDERSQGLSKKTCVLIGLK